jgi:hypothetical protein
MRRFALVMLAAAPLAACGGGGAAPTNDTEASNAGDTVARITAMNEGERNAVLFRAIRDAQRDCQRVERSTAAPAVAGKPAWVATCDDNSHWLVAIGNDGIAAVAPVAPS